MVDKEISSCWMSGRKVFETLYLMCTLDGSLISLFFPYCCMMEYKLLRVFCGSYTKYYCGKDNFQLLEFFDIKGVEHDCFVVSYVDYEIMW